MLCHVDIVVMCCALPMGLARRRALGLIKVTRLYCALPMGRARSRTLAARLFVHGYFVVLGLLDAGHRCRHFVAMPAS